MRTRFICCLVLGLWSGVARAESLALATSGPTDPAFVARVSDFLAELYAVPVRAAGTIEPVEGDLRAQARAACDLRRADELLLLLVFGNPDGRSHGALLRDIPVAAVNLAAMAPADAPEDLPAETYARRAERQAVRAVAFLLDLTYCPNPHCAAHPYQTLADLDTLARDLCPPCRGRAQQRLTGTSLEPEWAPPPAE
ncbi:MAG: hypothetical protein K9N49_07470 [Candidatus Marinimicrobia bacterium]|nr:hypothetical protein [Candidatus Neomarinimicrobiota bacterium]